jgi:hypothetical protein
MNLPLLQLINDALTFISTLLLNLLMTHLQSPVSPGLHSGASSDAAPASWVPGFSSPYFGFYVAEALAVVAVCKGLLLAHYNYRLSIIACR